MSMSKLLRFGNELRILHGGVERAAQCLHTLGRNAGRGHIGAADRDVGGEEGHHRLVLFGLCQLDDGRHVSKLRIALQCDLDEHEDLLLAQPVRLGRLPRGPGIDPRPPTSPRSIARLTGLPPG